MRELVSRSAFTYGATEFPQVIKKYFEEDSMHIYNVPGTNVTADVSDGKQTQVFLSTKGNKDKKHITIPELIALLERVRKEHPDMQWASQATLHPVLKSKHLSSPVGGWQDIDFSLLLTSLKNDDRTVRMAF